MKLKHEFKQTLKFRNMNTEYIIRVYEVQKVLIYVSEFKNGVPVLDWTGVHTVEERFLALIEGFQFIVSSMEDIEKLIYRRIKMYNGVLYKTREDEDIVLSFSMPGANIVSSYRTCGFAPITDLGFLNRSETFYDLGGKHIVGTLEEIEDKTLRRIKRLCDRITGAFMLSSSMVRVYLKFAYIDIILGPDNYIVIYTPISIFTGMIVNLPINSLISEFNLSSRMFRTVDEVARFIRDTVKSKEPVTIFLGGTKED